ncbi:unnamed protein product [Sphagnum jensenii]|uniref:DUF4395 domain-containing protein n=1 Tax=Sphagnum jensenii TaxID=128206 RepID=A0ABP0VGA1_9BRYO
MTPSDDISKPVAIEMGESKLLSNKQVVDNQDPVGDLIRSYDVIVISKSWCPYCFDKSNSSTLSQKQVQDYLKLHYRSSSVPHLFVKGVSLGGCTDLKELLHRGEAFDSLGPYMTGKPEAATEVQHVALFQFPDTVNLYVTRMTAFLTFLYLLLCIIFYDYAATPWVMLTLSVDCALRVYFGSAASPIGMGAQLLTMHWEPSLTAGPPKQFAAMCAWFFGTFAAGLWLGAQPVGGAIVAAIFAAAATLEWTIDFCAGCFVYGMAIRLGLLPAHMYHAHLNLLPARVWTYFHVNKRDQPTAGPSEHVLLPGQSKETPVDLVRKNRLEFEYKQQDINPLRHARVDLFSAPMTLAALAYCYKLTADGTTDQYSGADIGQWQTEGAYYTLGIAAAILWCAAAALYIVHALLHWRKVVKEWEHPLHGNTFTSVTIAAMLLGINYMSWDPVGGVSLVWLGASGQMLITVVRLADMIYGRVAEEYLTPGLMMAPVGNFAAALGFALYADVYPGPTRDGTMNYLYIARLWFGVAALFALVLFTITLRKAILDHHSDPRGRFTLWVWLATAAIAGPAYLAVGGFDPNAGRDVLFQSLYCIAIFFAALLFLGWARGFFSYVQDMSIWVMPFSCCALAINAILYYYYTYDLFSRVLVYFALAIASGTTAVALLHTTVWFFDGTLFKSRPKWGPVDFMKLTHECLRFTLPQLVTSLATLAPANTGALQTFLNCFEQMAVVYTEHGRHEDEVIFPAVRRYFPGLNPTMDEEHAHEHGVMEAMIKAVKAFHDVDPGSELYPSAAAAVIDVLRAELPGWVQHVLQHFRNEELTVTVAARKYLTVEQQVLITNEVYAHTPTASWAVVLPYVTHHLPLLTWKVRYVQCFLWADPARAQEIGLTLYRGCDDVTWAYLRDQIPAIVPRGLQGHKKVY